MFACVVAAAIEIGADCLCRLHNMLAPKKEVIFFGHGTIVLYNTGFHADVQQCIRQPGKHCNYLENPKIGITLTFDIASILNDIGLASIFNK